MLNFLIIQKGDSLGYISSNTRSSIWGVAKTSDKEELTKSLHEDFGESISIKFPKNSKDNLSLREQIAFIKLYQYMARDTYKLKLLLLNKEGGR